MIHEIAISNFLAVYKTALYFDKIAIASDVVKRPDGTISGLMIYTLEGTMSAAIGDYIIKGPKGEFWFNKRNIFEEMYEEVVND